MIIGIVIGAVLLVILIGVIVVYNGLIRLRNQMENAWSQIDVQLKRRHDLIPNLVETVKGYASHEKETLDAVITARNHAQGAVGKGVGAQAKAEGVLGGALTGLLAVAEAYPDLKANQNFLDLANELSQIENEIQMARRYFNGTVRNLNIMIEAFPSNLVAGQFGFVKAEFFEIEDPGDRKVPDVKF